MRLVFWQNTLSPHQVPFIRALASRGIHEVLLIAEREITPERLRCGWLTPSTDPVRVLMAPASVKELLDAESVHLFSGLDLSRWLRVAFTEALRARCHVGVIAERPDTTDMLGGVARRVKYTSLCLRARLHVRFFLAMGRSGVEWYRSCQYPEQRIFPFLYVTEPATDCQLPNPDASSFTVSYVGQCIRRKGLDIALRALAQTPTSCRFKIVGDGPELPALRRLANDLKISERVEFLGSLPNHLAVRIVAVSDVLLLPSRFDGWGAVVNEALQRGVPVICSDQCGASDLVDGVSRGTIFRAGDASALSNVLCRYLSRGRRTAAATREILLWAERIQPDAVAAYFTEVLACVYSGGQRPVASWFCDGPPSGAAI